MDAIITDIHGNLEALNAVLGAIRETAATRIICLGDLVCYGPDSTECVRLSNSWDIVLLGDWDSAILDHAPNKWSPTHNDHIKYIRSEFNDSDDADQLIGIIRSFKNDHIESSIHFAHGTPQDNREWVFPEDSYDPKKLNRIASRFNKVLVCGHAHINGIYHQNSDEEWEFIEPEPGTRYNVRLAQKTIVTVGSVGQPRDNDSRASFVLLDGNFAEFHRIAYDIEKTASKIRANPNIDNMYGERLAHGR
ncbi:MAG TPA: phosphoesterase [Planctomycetaceae bacterium]|nr:phosphoesterase [Planctomycetaceae bacterium]